MKKTVIAILLACITITLPACDQLPFSHKELPTEAGQEHPDEPADSDEDDKAGKKGKDGWASMDDAGKGKSKKDDDRIRYTYQTIPCELNAEGDVLANGYYDEITLPEDVKDKYPDLSDMIDQYNRSEHEKITSFLSESEAEIKELRAEGMHSSYYEERRITPLRSDGRVFSFSVMDDSYFAGAHGFTSFGAVNFDPEQGQEIQFNDVIKDSGNLADIIYEELIDQNEDLVEYFEQVPTDRENLLDNINAGIEDEGTSLTWGLSYDGMIFYFDDYAMGSYVAGSRQAIVRYKDHPEVFDDRYAFDKKGKNHDIDDLARKLDDADAVIVRTAGNMPSLDDRNEPQGKIVELSSKEQQKINLFLSNFAEQRMTHYDFDSSDVDELSYYAYNWSVINKPSNVKIEGDYYKIGFDTIKSLAKKYFGRDISDDIMYSYPWKDAYGGFAKNGWYYIPAADGESYALLAIADTVRELEKDVYIVDFSVYELDIDEYRDNNDSVPKKFYTLSPTQASSASDLTLSSTGRAVITRSDNSYILENYSLN